MRYYVLRRGDPEAWKCQPKRFLRPDQQGQAMRLSTMNLAIGGLLSGTFIYALQHGLKTAIYFDVAEYGWAWTLISTVLLFIAVDGLAYYAHRLLHKRVMFTHIHRWHHRYIATTPLVVTAMHPLELIMFQAATFLPMLVLPTYYLSCILVFVYILVFNIIDHSGVKLQSRLPWQGPSSFHDDHHVCFHCNFGQVLTFWDRFHDTLRPERIDQLIEVRVALETTAANRAIRLGHNGADALRRLEDIVREMEAMAARNDVFGFATADTSFNRTLCDLAGNAVLSDMWEMLARQMTIIFGLSALGKPMTDIVQEHWELIRVFGSGKLRDMAEAHNDHIDVEIHKVDLEKIIAARCTEAARPATPA